MAEPAYGMTTAELELFASTVSDLRLGRHQHSARHTIAQAILDLTHSERLVSYYWNPAKRQYHQPLLINLNADHAQHYLNNFQQSDPITPRMLCQNEAARIEDIVPRTKFERLEFYNEFLKPDDIYHGINVFLRSGDQLLFDFRLFRGKSSAAFNDRDLVLTKMLSNYLLQTINASKNSDLLALTARELDVAKLVSKGCTDSDIKRILGISFSTVRTHMNRCFEKLGCSNRSELAAFVSQRL